jgi:hypothetical protein
MKEQSQVQNHLLTKLKNTDVSTKEGALTYMELFKSANDILFRANDGFIGKNFKPYSVHSSWIFDKQIQARTTLKLNYWQMPYKKAAKKWRGLPLETWEKAKKEHKKKAKANHASK